MAEKNKSIIESALLDAKRIQEALNANTKEILRVVASEEIEKLMKESLEEDYVEEDADEAAEEEMEGAEETSTEDEIELDDESDDEIEMDGDTEFEVEIPDGELEMDSEEDLTGDDLEMDADAFEDDEMDMTGASIDDVISVYKKLTGNDEIEVVVDDESNDINLKVNEPGEFIIKQDETESFDDEDMMEGETMYEIELGEDDMPEAPSEEETDANQVYGNEEELVNEVDGEEAHEEEHIDEYIRKTEAQGRRAGAKHQPKAGGALEESTTKYNTLLTEAKELKSKNEEYKQALKQFRTMLAETVVFNSNLTYVTKLFMEHSTTKEEKQNILKRFDNEVSTLKESKKLYKTIASELSSKKVVAESVERKLNNELSSGISKQLNESTAYVDKETQRIKDLMSRVEKR